MIECNYWSQRRLTIIWYQRRNNIKDDFTIYDPIRLIWRWFAIVSVNLVLVRNSLQSVLTQRRISYNDWVVVLGTETGEHVTENSFYLCGNERIRMFKSSLKMSIVLGILLPRDIMKMFSYIEETSCKSEIYRKFIYITKIVRIVSR